MTVATVFLSRTEVSPSARPDWNLIFPVQQGIGNGIDYLSIYLDDQMEAIPGIYAISDSRGISLSLSGIAISRSSSCPTYTVSPDLRRISIPVRRVVNAPNTFNIKIPFRWKSHFLVPRMINLAIEIVYFGARVYRQSIQGYNVNFKTGVSDRLVDFLERAKSTAFLFPQDQTSVDLVYPQLSPIVSKIQRFPDTTVWGTTWPSEVPFWRSFHGQEYLAMQIVATRRDQAAVSKRIAICPLSISLTDSETNDFFEEMEIQSQCGVFIKLVDGYQLRDLLGNGIDALLTFGGSVGVVYQNLQGHSNGKPAAVKLLLSQDQVSDVRDRYRKLIAGGSHWNEYKERRRVLFGSEARRRISDRVEGTQARAWILERHKNLDGAANLCPPR